MSTTISMKAPEELARRIEEAQEEGESRSACVRRLVRGGLDARNRGEHTVSLPVALIWGGSLAVTAQYVDASGALGPLGVTAFLIGILLTREALYDRLSALAALSTDSDRLPKADD